MNCFIIFLLKELLGNKVSRFLLISFEIFFIDSKFEFIGLLCRTSRVLDIFRCCPEITFKSRFNLGTRSQREIPQSENSHWLITGRVLEPQKSIRIFFILDEEGWATWVRLTVVMFRQWWLGRLTWDNVITKYLVQHFSTLCSRFFQSHNLKVSRCLTFTSTTSTFKAQKTKRRWGCSARIKDYYLTKPNFHRVAAT